MDAKISKINELSKKKYNFNIRKEQQSRICSKFAKTTEY